MSAFSSAGVGDGDDGGDDKTTSWYPLRGSTEERGKTDRRRRISDDGVSTCRGDNGFVFLLARRAFGRQFENMIFSSLLARKFEHGSNCRGEKKIENEQT